ncbi:TPA: hypothetical protein DEA21_00400 [Candidatus Uhrbacteria bacterium]|nr:hypothetical protein [Candidatus Uhrbacteria bacterium]
MSRRSQVVNDACRQGSEFGEVAMAQAVAKVAFPEHSASGADQAAIVRKPRFVREDELLEEVSALFLVRQDEFLLAAVRVFHSDLTGNGVIEHSGLRCCNHADNHADTLQKD